MRYVVLDTDVASNLLKNRLPGSMLAKLAPLAPCVTFVTIGEMVQWGELRSWGRRTLAGLDAWLSTVVPLGCDETVARTWGHLSAQAQRRGRPRPVNDMWIAATCIAEGLPLATLNVKDFEDFAEYDGLRLVAP